MDGILSGQAGELIIGFSFFIIAIVVAFILVRSASAGIEARQAQNHQSDTQRRS
ncbi:MAG TPA: hypothetical protein VFE42_14320 [Chloroflexota bacterium]|nr:hypothetical protein [Chloroflexota bacterium]